MAIVPVLSSLYFQPTSNFNPTAGQSNLSIVVAAVDQVNNAIAIPDGTSCSLQDSLGSGLTGATAAASGGVVNFTNATFQLAGAHSLTPICSGLNTSGQSKTFTVSPGTPVMTLASLPSTVYLQKSFSMSVKVVDAFGNPESNASVLFTTNDPGAISNGATSVSTNGLATLSSITLSLPGTVTATFTCGGVSLSIPIQVVETLPKSIYFASGVPTIFTPTTSATNVQISGQDILGNPLPLPDGTMCSLDLCVGTPSIYVCGQDPGAVQATAAQGKASFVLPPLPSSDGNYYYNADCNFGTQTEGNISPGDFKISSAPFAANGFVNSLYFNSFPLTKFPAGTNFPVTVCGPSNNPIPAGAVGTLSLATNGPGGLFPPVTATADGSGCLAFAGVNLQKAGSYTLKASVLGVNRTNTAVTATSDLITIFANSSVTFSTQTVTTTMDQNLNLTFSQSPITAIDSFGNPYDSSDQGGYVLGLGTILSGPATGTLNNQGGSFSNGVAIFSGMTLANQLPAGNYVFSFPVMTLSANNTLQMTPFAPITFNVTLPVGPLAVGTSVPVPGSSVSSLVSSNSSFWNVGNSGSYLLNGNAVISNGAMMQVNTSTSAPTLQPFTYTMASSNVLTPPTGTLGLTGLTKGLTDGNGDFCVLLQDNSVQCGGPSIALQSIANGVADIISLSAVLADYSFFATPNDWNYGGIVTSVLVYVDQQNVVRWFAFGTYQNCSGPDGITFGGCKSSTTEYGTKYGTLSLPYSKGTSLVSIVQPDVMLSELDFATPSNPSIKVPTYFSVVGTATTVSSAQALEVCAAQSGFSCQSINLDPSLRTVPNLSPSEIDGLPQNVKAIMPVVQADSLNSLNFPITPLDPSQSILSFAVLTNGDLYAIYPENPPANYFGLTYYGNNYLGERYIARGPLIKNVTKISSIPIGSAVSAYAGGLEALLSDGSIVALALNSNGIPAPKESVALSAQLPYPTPVLQVIAPAGSATDISGSFYLNASGQAQMYRP